MDDDKLTEFWLIACKTGCSCCSHENHWREPYRAEADAKRRVEYYMNKDGGFHPLNSQYANDAEPFDELDY